MRRLFAVSLGLSLCLLGAGARADDFQWRRVPSPAVTEQVAHVPSVSIGRAIPLTAREPDQRTACTVGVGRPVALSIDGDVRTASYSGGQATAPSGLVFRAKREDPMAVGDPEKIGVQPSVVQGGISAAPAHGSVASQFGADCCGADCCGDACASSCAPACGRCSAFASCGADCCGADGCHKPCEFWISGEYLLWGIKDSRYPPLVTVSPVAVPMAGIVTTPGTTTILGGSHPVDNEAISGGRFGIGIWLDEGRACGLEAGFFWLGRRSNSFFDSSPGLPVIARPFLDVTGATPFENAEIVASPNVLAGSVRVATTSSLWGGDINFREHWLNGALCGHCYHADFLAGFRYAELQESLKITEALTVLPGANIPRLLTATGPATISVMDSFKTTNQFFGGQVGCDGEITDGRWFLGLNTKVGLGMMRETVDVAGLTSISVPAIRVVTTTPGGLLAQQSNSGRRSRDTFAVVPEVGLKLGYNVTDHLRLFAGYNFLYMSSVVRPGDQIDRAINTSQLPTIIGAGAAAGHPAPTIRGTDFWAQGVSIGAELRY